MSWVTPVYDRTETDIVNKTEKSYIAAVDLDRIEGNIKWLRLTIESFGFETAGLSKSWTMYGLPDIGDVKRILQNAQELVEKYGINPPAEIPLSMRGYPEINAIEENLMCLKKLVDWTINSVIKTGTYYSGQWPYLWRNNPLEIHNADFGAHPFILSAIGNEDMLATNAKTLVGAINEVIGLI